MRKRTSLLNKLSAYSAVAAALINNREAVGQIMYTDIDPYIEMAPDQDIFIDLNNDGVYEFSHYYWTRYSYTSASGGTGTFFTYEGFGPNAMVSFAVSGSSFSSVYDLAELNSGDTIDNDLSWMHVPVNAGNNFSAFKIKDSGNEYFGWMRLSYDAGLHAYLLYDYAINLTPNDEIIAGDKGCTSPQTLSIIRSDEQLESNQQNNIQWYKDGIEIPGETNQIFIPAQAGYYSVRQGDVSGCLTSSPGYYFQFCNQLVDSIEFGLPLCVGDMIRLEPYPSEYYNPITSVKWFSNGNEMVGYEGEFSMPSHSGKNTVVVSAGQVCADSASVYANPNPETPEITSVALGVYETDSSTEYQWFQSYSWIPGATYRQFAPWESGWYSVIVTNEAGCPSTSESEYLNGLSNYDFLVDSNDYYFSIKGFSGNVYVALKDEEYYGGDLIVSDMNGKVIFATLISGPTIPLELENVSPGTYVVSILKRNKVVSKKFVKI